MEIEHLRLGRDDVLFIPSPLAHQTGFLYGMWEAFVLGATQLLQDVWEPHARRAGAARVGRILRAGRDAVPDRPRPRRRGGRAAPERAAHLRRDRRRGAARARRARDLGARHGGPAAPGAPRSPAWGPSRRPATSRAKRWGTDGRALAGTADPHHRRRGHRARGGPGGQLRGASAAPVRGLPRAPGSDRRGAHARRLVPHRRPRDGRQRRVPADHAAASPTSSTGAGRRSPSRRSSSCCTVIRRSRTSRSSRCPTRGSESAPARSSSARRRRAPTSRPCAEYLARARRRPAVLARAHRGRSTRLPRNASGKIQKFLLRELAAGLTPSTEKEPVR